MNEVYQELREALLDYDEDAAVEAANKVVEQKLDAVEAMDVLIKAIEEVGTKFEKGDAFLPELILASETMKAGIAILTESIPAEERGQKLGTVVIGTVRGDLHDIGKNIVKTLMEVSGFNVVDIGMDAPPALFAEAAQKNNADIVAASAIMSTTLPGIKDVVDYFEFQGIHDKYPVIGGGGVVTPEFIEQIGADGYGEDAVDAVKVAKSLLK